MKKRKRASSSPIPSEPYEPAVWRNPKVGIDYLITDGLNKSSVPYDLIGETVDVRVSKNTVEVFYHGTRIAVHVRLSSRKRDLIVKPEHMPETHRKYLRYNAEKFKTWAASVSPYTEKVVHHFLTEGKEAEQGYKSCVSLTKLEKTYSASRLEDACGRVLALASAPTIRNIVLLIKSASARGKTPQGSSKDIQNQKENNNHGITRGAAYYSRGGQHHE